MAETDLHIVERLRKLLPPLTSDEKRQLRENIKADGVVQYEILWWFDGTRKAVVDGMHRWEIVRGTDIPYKTKEMHFANYEEAEIWILNHQLGRRNLIKPSDFRKVVAELYNRMKSQRGGDRKSSESKAQNEPLIATTAEIVGESAGISPAKVKRVVSRVASEKTLTKAAQAIADKASDAEVKDLSKLSPDDQNQVARAVRTGQAKTIKDGMKGFKPEEPAKPSNGKPPKQYDRGFYYKQWNTSIGPLVRLVDKIAREVDEMHGARHRGVKEGLDLATRNMIEWMGVKK